MKAFKLGKLYSRFKIRVNRRKEVLIHQSCDELIDEIDHEETEEKLKRINDIIEWSGGEIENNVAFWIYIEDAARKLEDDLKDLLKEEYE